MKNKKVIPAAAGVGKSKLPALIDLPLLCKLGSIVVHCAEFFETGHPFDKQAADALLRHPDVLAWQKKMDAQGLLPVKRSKTNGDS